MRKEEKNINKWIVMYPEENGIDLYFTKAVVIKI